MSKVLTGVQDDRIFFKPVRKPDPPKYDSSQPEKMEVEVMFNIYYSLSTDEPVQWVHNMICKYAQLHMSQFQSISRLYARWHSNIIIYVFQIRITSFTSLILPRCSSTRSELSNTRIGSPSLVKSVASLESPGPRFKLQNHCYAKHNHMSVIKFFWYSALNPNSARCPIMFLSCTSSQDVVLKIGTWSLTTLRVMGASLLDSFLRCSWEAVAG